jgi:hypothetical protein
MDGMEYGLLASHKTFELPLKIAISIFNITFLKFILGNFLLKSIFYILFSTFHKNHF